MTLRFLSFAADNFLFENMTKSVRVIGNEKETVAMEDVIGNNNFRFLKIGATKYQYETTYVLSGSRRQSNAIEQTLSNQYPGFNLPSSFATIERVAGALGAEFIPFLMADLYSGLEVGASLDQSQNTGLTFYNDSLLDTSKILLLYTQIQLAAEIAKQTPYVFEYIEYADKKGAAINGLKTYFKAHPYLIPNNCTLFLNGFDEKVDETIQGTGLYDASYPSRIYALTIALADDKLVSDDNGISVVDFATVVSKQEGLQFTQAYQTFLQDSAPKPASEAMTTVEVIEKQIEESPQLKDSTNATSAINKVIDSRAKTILTEFAARQLKTDKMTFRDQLSVYASTSPGLFGKRHHRAEVLAVLNESMHQTDAELLSGLKAKLGSATVHSNGAVAMMIRAAEANIELTKPTADLTAKHALMTKLKIQAADLSSKTPVEAAQYFIDKYTSFSLFSNRHHKQGLVIFGQLNFINKSNLTSVKDYYDIVASYIEEQQSQGKPINPRGTLAMMFVVLKDMVDQEACFVPDEAPSTERVFVV